MPRDKTISELANAIPSGKKLVVFDLDKTLVANEGMPPDDNEVFLTAPSHSALVQEVKKQKRRKGVTVVFITGRQEQFRPATAAWLKKRGFDDISLYMRKDGMPLAYTGRWKGQKVAKLVRNGNFTSVRMYEDNKGFLTRVKNTLDPMKIPFTGLLCSKGVCKEIY